ncbi:hypothetical protein CASFOL_005189 [Castilleja foliolosa]|uniref:Histone H2A n=1 Tax=Castilleja foliolosa TaxID=1961234 RepID=A0ABD3E2S3_9LAMI
MEKYVAWLNFCPDLSIYGCGIYVPFVTWVLAEDVMPSYKQSKKKNDEAKLTQQSCSDILARDGCNDGGSILAAVRSEWMQRNSGERCQFPVGLIAGFLKSSKYAERVGAGAPVTSPPFRNTCLLRVLELAGNAARDDKKTMIVPRCIQAVRTDEELSKVFGDVTIANGGVMPHIYNLPKKAGGSYPSADDD